MRQIKIVYEKPQLIRSYRNCLKQLMKLHKIEPLIAEHFSEALQNLRKQEYLLEYRDYHQLKSVHECTLFIKAFDNLMAKVNAGHKKSELKLMRIFLNKSKYISNNLVFSHHYYPKSLQKLYQDQQYCSLSQKDQEFVKSVVNKICNRKIKSIQFRFKSVAQYLQSNTSQSSEPQISLTIHNNQGLLQLKQYFKGRKTEISKMFNRLSSENQQKFQYAIEELYDNNILLI